MTTVANAKTNIDHHKLGKPIGVAPFTTPPGGVGFLFPLAGIKKGDLFGILNEKRYILGANFAVAAYPFGTLLQNEIRRTDSLGRGLHHKIDLIDTARLPTRGMERRERHRRRRPNKAEPVVALPSDTRLGASFLKDRPEVRRYRCGRRSLVRTAKKIHRNASVTKSAGDKSGHNREQHEGNQKLNKSKASIAFRITLE
jgi:hypothetical protein